MHPNIIGPVHTYGVMLLIGFYAGWILSLRLARRDGVEGRHISDLLVYTVISGIIGARVTYIITEANTLTSFWDVFKIWEGGLVFYGGLATGTATLLWVMVRRKLRIAKVADVIAPGIALGLMFGRIGCLGYGCCWGQVAEESPIAIRFPGKFIERKEVPGTLAPDGSPAFLDHLYQGWLLPQEADESHTMPVIGADGRILGFAKPGPAKSLPVIPTQPISSLANLLICMVALLWFRFRRRYGDVFLVFAVLYSAFRFTIEFYRINPPVLWGLSFSQCFSLAFGLLCVIMLIRSLTLPVNLPSGRAVAPKG